MTLGAPVQNYLDLLAQLRLFDPPVFVFGGFAEDALLHGSVSRPHSDVDILADRTTLDHHLRDAERIGLTGFEVLFEPKDGIPLVMAASTADLNLEITVYDRTDEGGVFCWMTDAGGRPVQIHLSPGTFEYPESAIDGVQVRTVSPLALYQIRAGVTAAGAFGPPRPNDVMAQEMLRFRFFPHDDPETLQPRILPA
jgi:hypothetical protein